MAKLHTNHIWGLQTIKIIINSYLVICGIRIKCTLDKSQKMIVNWQSCLSLPVIIKTVI